MPERKVTLPSRLTRSMPIERADVDEDARTVELAFSSEQPVERFFGVEILDHSPSSIRLDRIRTGGPLLMDHDPTDQVGVVEEVRIGEDRIARARVRFGRSARAEEVLQDVRDGIRRHVSVGYRIHRLLLEESDGDQETYRAVDWEPYEISLVSVPADYTVGVGRGAEDCDVEVTVMSDTVEMTREAPEAQAPQTKPAPAPDIKAVENEVRERELKRIRDLESIGERFAHLGGRELAMQAIREGWSVSQMRDALLERLPTEASSAPSADMPGKLDLSQRELQRYSLFRAIRAMTKGATKMQIDDAAFELECSREIAERIGRDPRGVFVPLDIFASNFTPDGKRVMSTTTAAGLVGTDHLASRFIENLRASSVVLGLNATVIEDLQGNVDIPKKTGSATFYWLAEDANVTDSDAAIGSVQMSPKTVAGSVPMTRRLLKQSSPSVEAVIQRDLVQGAALAIDKAALEGTGTGGQPQGIVNVTGVNTQTVATPGSPTWDEIVGFETAVATDNALLGTLAYVTTAGVVGSMKTTKKDAGSGIFVMEGGETNGYRVAVSNQLTANRIIFGNFEDVLIGMWGVLDIMPDEATKAASGGLVLRVFQDVDVAVRHAESFCINA